ncbi:MAG: ImmA/IrrE family metallo-endopeptidase [Oligoflexus sp.]
MIAIFPQIAKLVAKADMENLVCMVRKYYGGPDAYAPVLSVERLLVHAGIPTQTSKQVSVGALVAEDHQGRFTASVILHPKIQDPIERNLLLAHLLGHFLLQVQPEIAQAMGRSHGYKEEISPLSRLSVGGISIDEIDWQDEEDRQADLFALALLLPMGMIKRSVTRLQTVEKIAAFFELSPDLIQLRLNQLHISANETGIPETSPRQMSPRSSPATAPVTMEKITKKPNLSETSLDVPKLSPEKNLESMETEAAILRGQRLIAGQRYRKQPDEAPQSEKSQAKKADEPLEGGLKRLRAIAKRLDSSVKI